MADPAKKVIAVTIDTMALDMGATWDSALNWAATTDALIGIIAEINGKVDQVQFATLLGAAAMARRQSLKIEPEVGHDERARQRLAAEVVELAARPTRAWNTEQDWHSASRDLVGILADPAVALSDTQIATLKEIAAASLRRSVRIQRAARAQERGA